MCARPFGEPCWLPRPTAGEPGSFVWPGALAETVNPGGEPEFPTPFPEPADVPEVWGLPCALALLLWPGAFWEFPCD